MIKIITDYNAGAVATVNDDGTPAVSPKATFVIVDDNCIAFGDIRSPGTTANIKQRPIGRRISMLCRHLSASRLRAPN